MLPLVTNSGLWINSDMILLNLVFGLSIINVSFFFLKKLYNFQECVLQFTSCMTGESLGDMLQKVIYALLKAVWVTLASTYNQLQLKGDFNEQGGKLICFIVHTSNGCRVFEFLYVFLVVVQYILKYFRGVLTKCGWWQPDRLLKTTVGDCRSCS